MMNVISLGAGVQSSTMALMAAHGEITPMPDCAIFADTQAEPKAVYDWLDWLEKQLPFPVYRVTAGNLADNSMKGINSTGQKFSVVPWYMKGSIARRQCSSEYKVKPIYKKMREMGATYKQPFTVWIGISRDEAHRAKPQSLSRDRDPSRPGTRLRGPARHALEMRADRLCPAAVMAAIGVARMHRPRPRRQALCRLKSEVRAPHTIMVSNPVIPSAAQATRSAACRWLHARAAPTADRPRSRGPSTHSGSPLRRAR